MSKARLPWGMPGLPRDGGLLREFLVEVVLDRQVDGPLPLSAPAPLPWTDDSNPRG